MPWKLGIVIAAAMLAGMVAWRGIGERPAAAPGNKAAAQTAQPSASQSSPALGPVFRDCDECPEMVAIPAGSFMMGSGSGEKGRTVDEGPQHRVTIARPFAVGKYEVTFDEWDACVAAGGCRHTPSDSQWGRGRQPVIDVSWEDAQAYAEWVSKKTGKAYRLPSEAEWEYAARAGSGTRYPWADEPGNNHGNFRESGSNWSGRQTAPVGKFPANAFGLHDMIGNVREWTQDCWNGSYGDAPADGNAWESGDCGRRVVRDGSWNNKPEKARAAFRSWSEPRFQFKDLGFRLVRTL